MDDPPPPRTAAELRAVGCRQRAVLVVLAAEAAIWFGYAGGMGSGLARDNGEAAVALGGVTALLGLVSGVAVGLLVSSIRGPVAGMTLGALAAVPVLGWVVTLAVHAAATRSFRRHGVRVGAFGVVVTDPADLGPAGGGPGGELDEGW